MKILFLLAAASFLIGCSSVPKGTWDYRSWLHNAKKNGILNIRPNIRAVVLYSDPTFKGSGASLILFFFYNVIYTYERKYHN